MAKIKLNYKKDIVEIFKQLNILDGKKLKLTKKLEKLLAKIAKEEEKGDKNNGN